MSIRLYAIILLLMGSVILGIGSESPLIGVGAFLIGYSILFFMEFKK